MAISAMDTEMAPGSGEEREATLLKIGLVQLIMAALLAFSLINRHHNLTLLLLVLLAFIYGARLWSRFCPARLVVSWGCENFRVFPGEEVHLTVKADNRKALPLWLRVAVPVPQELDDGSGQLSVREQGLLWYQTVVFDWRLRPARRGIYPLGPPRISAGDLMGLYPRAMDGQGPARELIVFPRLVPLKPFAHIRKDLRKDLFGRPGAKSPVEDPIYLLGTRDYQAGRPSRSIHWAASARLNRLQERVFEPSRQARVLLALDVAPFARYHDEALFEEAVEVLASLAVACDRQGFAVGLVANGKMAGDRSPMVAVDRGGGQAPRILETLAGLTWQAAQPLDETLRKVRLDGGMSCIVFLLDEKDGSTRLSAVLRQKNVSAKTVYCLRPDRIAPLGRRHGIMLDDLLPRMEQPA